MVRGCIAVVAVGVGLNGHQPQEWTRDAFFDLLRIRASSSLFRLRSGDEIARRLTFYNTGPSQVHRATGAADARAATSSYAAASGAFGVPARTAVVFVAE